MNQIMCIVHEATNEMVYRQDKHEKIMFPLNFGFKMFIVNNEPRIFKIMEDFEFQQVEGAYKSYIERLEENPFEKEDVTFNGQAGEFLHVTFTKENVKTGQFIVTNLTL